MYRDLAVPDVLLNGDHARIRAWRRQQALRETLRRRPDLFAQAPMTDRERAETLAAAQAEAEAGAAVPEGENPQAPLPQESQP